MSFDIIGEAPTEGMGRRFCRTNWVWKPMWTALRSLCPTSLIVKNWNTNDSDGLNALGASALASELECALESHRCVDWLAGYRAAQTMGGPQRCWLCCGTGKRKPPPERGPGNVRCNVCDGTGRIPQNAERYPVDLSDFQEFLNFLQTCGGFEIR